MNFERLVKVEVDEKGEERMDVALHFENGEVKKVVLVDGAMTDVELNILRDRDTYDFIFDRLLIPTYNLVKDSFKFEQLTAETWPRLQYEIHWQSGVVSDIQATFKGGIVMKYPHTITFVPQW